MNGSRTETSNQLPLDRRRILLVDDDSQLLSTLSSYLFRAGAWDVWQAHSIERARELWSVHESQIDVVIADIRLQDGNGLELLWAFRQERPGLFGLAITGAVLNPLPPECDALLLKPFTAETLVQALAKI